MSQLKTGTSDRSQSALKSMERLQLALDQIPITAVPRWALRAVGAGVAHLGDKAKSWPCRLWSRQAKASSQTHKTPAASDSPCGRQVCENLSDHQGFISNIPRELREKGGVGSGYHHFLLITLPLGGGN